MNPTILALAHAYALCLLEMHQSEVAWHKSLDYPAIKRCDQARYMLDEAKTALEAACEQAANAK